MNTQNTVEIIPFSSDLKEHVKILNIEWLQKYFRVEERDEYVLSNRKKKLLTKADLFFTQNITMKL